MRRVYAIAAAALLVIGSIAGVKIASYLSGGGLQPTALLPADVSAAMVLDLNPALDQKLAVRSLASHFPSTKGSSDTDLRIDFISLVLPGCGNANRDVRPWLGSRVALALPSASGSIAPIAVIQIRAGRTEKARDGLARIAACSHGDVRVGVRDGYALVARSDALLARMMAVPRSASLGRDPTYTSDLAILHGHQVATIWGDGRRVDSLLDHVADWLPLGHTIRPLLPRLRGRAVVGVHATGTYAEMQVATIGTEVKTPTGEMTGPETIASAPNDLIAAAFTARSLNPLIDTLVKRVVPRSLTSLGPIGRLLRIPSLQARTGPDGGRVLTLAPSSKENKGLRTTALASIPGHPALVLFVRPDVLPGAPTVLKSIRAIGVVVTTSGTARIRVVA